MVAHHYGINNLMARLLNVLVRPHSYLCSCCSNLSNFNYKLQVGSDRQHLALYMDRHLRLIAIMIEVTSRHTECTHFNLDLQSDATCCETMVLSSLATLFYKKKGLPTETGQEELTPGLPTAKRPL